MSRLKQALRKLLPLAFWLLVWAVCARAVGKDLLLAPPSQVLRRFSFVGEASFWHTVGMSLWRTALAYGIGVALACVLAVLCRLTRWLDDLVAPALSVIRATPVASFIILALVWLNSSNVPILAGVLMVLPVVYASAREGIDSADRNLLEMARMFGWSRGKTWLRVILPSALPPVLAACEACVGLCFKAAIAAEVIGTPKNAIGTRLYSAKIYLETDALLAWTLVVILLSITLEKLLRLLIRRLLKGRLSHVHHA